VRVVLSRGMRLALGVRRILPDVLVFDTPVPDAPAYANASVRGDEDVPPVPPLPDLLPERACAYIRPDAWLPALNSLDNHEPDPDSGDGACAPHATCRSGPARRTSSSSPGQSRLRQVERWRCRPVASACSLRSARAPYVRSPPSDLRPALSARSPMRAVNLGGVWGRGPREFSSACNRLPMNDIDLYEGGPSRDSSSCRSSSSHPPFLALLPSVISDVHIA
jgi:hypothetical protein